MGGLAWKVARAIPAEYLSGLVSGVYQLHGGVLRDGAGRIVAHLVMPELARSVTSLVPGLNVISDLVTTGQLMALGRSVEQIRQSVETVLTATVAAATVSGLGLVTSLGGVSYLSHRLSKLDSKLSSIEKGHKKIELLIKSHQKAQLYGTLDLLRDAGPRGRSRRREQLLVQCKKDFVVLAHYYREILSNADNLEEIDGADEFYALSFTGAAYVSSELGMGSEASSYLREHIDSWSHLVRQHARTLIVDDSLGRLLDAELVDILPAAELVELLDFVEGTQKGVDWFDELRRAQVSMVRRMDPRKLQWIAKARPKIEAVRRLRARHQVLDSTAAHFSLLAGAGLSVSGFERKVGQVSVKHGPDPLMIRLKTGS